MKDYIPNPNPRSHESMLTYRIGDATQPPERPAIIIHSCNDVGAWGAGFVMALSKRWAAPEQAYHAMPDKSLGQMCAVEVEPGLHVCNMILQHKVNADRYTSTLHVEECFNQLDSALDRWPGEVPSIHAPRIGCGLGRAKWTDIQHAFELCFPRRQVFVYDLTMEDRYIHHPHLRPPPPPPPPAPPPTPEITDA